MGFLNEIKQRFSIEGLDDAGKKMLGFGQAGEDAFKRIKGAADKAPLAETAGKLDKLKLAATDLANGMRSGVSGLSDFGGTLTTLAGRTGPLGLAIAGVAGAMVALTKSAADSIVSTKRQAEAFGLTAQQYLALKKGAREAGVGTDELSTAMTRFAGKASTEAEGQLKSLVDLLKEVAKTMPGGGFALPKNATADELRPTKEAEEFAKLSDAFGDPVQIVRGPLAYTEQLKKLREAIVLVTPQLKSMFQAADDPRGQLPDKVLEGRLFQQASRGDAEGRKLRDLMRDLGVDPGTGAARGTDKTFENLDQIVAKSEGSLKSLQIALLDNKGAARSTFDVILDLADKFKAMPDGFQKAGLAAKIFGRSVGPELLPLLNQGSGGLDAVMAKMKQLGIVFDESAFREAQKARLAFQEIDESLTRFKNKLGIAAAPYVTSFLGNLRDTLKQDMEDIRKLGELWDWLVNKFKGGSKPQPQQKDVAGDAGPASIPGAEGAAIPSLPPGAGPRPAWLESLTGQAREIWGKIKQIFGAEPLPDKKLRIVTELVDKDGTIIINRGGGGPINRVLQAELSRLSGGAGGGSDRPLIDPAAGRADSGLGLEERLARNGVPLSENIDDQRNQRTGAAHSKIIQVEQLLQTVADSLTAPGMRDGGLISGPGTGKSDSILARFAGGRGIRVSNGEFIVDSEGKNLGAAIDHFVGRFANGGMLSDVSAPRLSGGSRAIAPAGGGLHPITLQFPWGGTVGGFQASPNAVEQFSREADLAQRASAGRKGSMWGT